MRRPPTIVFDVAQVLLGWQPTAMLREVVPHLAPDAAAAQALEATLFQGWGGDWAEFDRGRLDEAGVVARIVARTALPAAEVAAVVQAIPRALVPLAGTVALLQRLKAGGHRVVCLSNMPAPYVQVLQAGHAFFGAFDDGIFSAEVGLIKPEAAIYALAEARFGAAPAQLVFLDDTAVNIDAARARGWRTVHFQHPAQAEAALRAWPDVVLGG
jgi:putative hydrolase of the HAD superfamily